MITSDGNYREQETYPNNHPSADPAPSQIDIAFTKKLNTTAQAMGIVLHDHLIVGKNDHFSFKSNGLL